MSRCFLLLLLAAAASFESAGLRAEEASAINASDSDLSVVAKGSDDARLAFLNAIVDAPKVDVIADNKYVFKRSKFGRREKPRNMKPEGYLFDIVPSKVGMPLVDNLTTALLAGRDYTLVPMGDLNTTAPVSPLLVDIPGQFVPKVNCHVVFVNASPDSPPLQLVLDDTNIGTTVSAGSWIGPLIINEGKHRVEVFDGDQRVINERVEKFKGKRTVTLVVHGTFEGNDGSPLNLEFVEAKTR